MSADTLACTYAALICHDSGVAPTADNIQKAVTAAGVEVRNTLPILFARFLEKKSIASLFEAAAVPPSTAAGGIAAAVAAAAPAAPSAGGAKADKKAAAPAEEEDDEMGFDLFG